MSETTTEFNSSVATLERIDTLLKWSRDALYSGDLIAYYSHLQNLRKEAMCKMKHTTKKGDCKDDCIMCKCEKDFAELKQLYTLYRTHQENYELKTQFSEKLDNYEIFLRNFMDSKGMLLKDNMSGGLD